MATSWRAQPVIDAHAHDLCNTCFSALCIAPCVRKSIATDDDAAMTENAAET
jgi:hypothetical protein